MAIIGSLSIARSGLVATRDAMSVTANNIANVNTTAFKGSRPEFADLLSTIRGGVEVGLGTRLAAASQTPTQGNIESTGRSTDLAIEGNGFFVLGDGAGLVYSRAGDFRIDKDGFLVNLQGLRVQGFQLNSEGQAIGGLVDIGFAKFSTEAAATTRITLRNNLQSDAPIIPGGFDGSTFDSANSTANFTTTVPVFDSLGQRHDLTLFFTRTGAGAWDVNVGVDAGETGGTTGDLNVLGTVSLTFDSSGALTGPDPTDLPAVTFNGAAAQTITLDFGTPTTAPDDGLGRDGVVQLAGSSNVAGTQNGFAAGDLQGIAFDTDGLLTGIFNNGQTRPLFQLALADFAAPDRLTSLGNQLFRESVTSGSPAIGKPDSSGLGRIIASSLERSNVDLAQEFIDLISLQRAFQANARVITTSDGLLTDLINIVR